MGDQEIKEKVRRLFEEGFNQGNFGLADDPVNAYYIDHKLEIIPAT